MNKKKSLVRQSRRDFLKLAAAAGVTMTAVHLLDTYTPWIHYDQTASQTWRPFASGSSSHVQKQELVRYATLAANGHNTQPWKFAIQDFSIDIHPDNSRQLAVVDSHNRELWISLGCALENLLIAARTIGYTARVTYPDDVDVIRVQLVEDTPRADPLFSAIVLRQNTRSEYNGRLIRKPDLDQLKALPLEPGVAQFFALNPTLMERVLSLVSQGTLTQYSDKAYLDELMTWLRFNKKEAEATFDGLYTRCSGNPEVPRWLGQLFVAGTKPDLQADSDARKYRSSPTVVIIASEQDDKTAWVRTGQVYERLALTMTALGIRSALLNQPVEVTGLRSQIQDAMEMGAYHPQMVVRFGYADPKTPVTRSLRRPIEQVLL